MLALTIAMVTSLGIAERVSAQGMGITIGAAPGVGVATPVSKVFETGAQWGTTFTAAVGCRFNRWEIALEPWLMYTGYGVYSPEKDTESHKIRRAAFFLSGSRYLDDRDRWYIRAGVGIGSYTSYNKQRPASIPSYWPSEGSYGSNALALMGAISFDWYISSTVCIPIGLYLTNLSMPSLKYEGVKIDSKPFSTQLLMLQVGVSVKSYKHLQHLP